MKIFNERTVVNFAYPKAPEKIGYLLKKRSETKRSFNRRYFVLNGNILVYSENEFSREPLGVIFLEGHSVELVDERMFAIHFHTADYTGRSYILQAESEAEAESWMQALAHCGSEFLSLSVEELEDALRELNSLTDCPDSGIREGSAQCSPAVTTPSSAATVGNRNPFNAPIASPRDHRQRYQKQQQHSIVHLTGLLTLSWERMQASVREYLDGAVASAEVTEQKHQ
ncbi:Sesquipedalian-1 [Taenia solium]|eukprot:TsM_000294500 transcript=TsM_000294500 gene=TsM_000294500